LAAGTYLLSRFIAIELKAEEGIWEPGKQTFQGVPAGQNPEGPSSPAGNGIGLLDN